MGSLVSTNVAVTTFPSLGNEGDRAPFSCHWLFRGFTEAQDFSDVYLFVIFSENLLVGSTVSERSVGETHLRFCYAVLLEKKLTQYEMFLA